MRKAALILAILSAGALAAPAHADKLVVFKNGKALLVKKAEKADGWLKCEFEDGNFMSVPMKGVSQIMDSSLKASHGSTANQVAEGGPGYSRGAQASPPGRGGRLGRDDADSPDEPQADGAAAALQEEQELRSVPQPGLPRSFRRGNRTPGNNAVVNSPRGNVPNSNGLTPLNQVRAPFGGRGAVGNRNPPRTVDPSQDKQQQPNQTDLSGDDN